MNFSRTVAELRQEIYKACISHINLLKDSEPKDSISGYCLFSTDGFLMVNAIANSIDNVENLLAYEWTHLDNSHWEVFNIPNRLISAISNELMEGEFEDLSEEEIDSRGTNYPTLLFGGILCETLLLLKTEGYFDAEVFNKDLILTIQIPDPDKENEEICYQFNRQLMSPQVFDKFHRQFKTGIVDTSD